MIMIPASSSKYFSEKTNKNSFKKLHVIEQLVLNYKKVPFLK